MTNFTESVPIEEYRPGLESEYIHSWSEDVVHKLEESFANVVKYAAVHTDKDSRESFIESTRKTPSRAANALSFLTSGYKMTADEVINGALFDAQGNDELIIVKDIEFFSLCEHHLLPFMGQVHVGYIPCDKIIGLSKIPRIVDMYSRRLQIQERLTSEICDCLTKALNASACGVVVEAKHLCCSSRGVMKQNAYMKTSALRGYFKSDESARSEFMQLVAKG